MKNPNRKSLVTGSHAARATERAACRWSLAPSVSVLMAIASLACGAAEEAQGEESMLLGAGQAALTSDTGARACDVHDLAPLTCAGTWQYRRWATCDVSDSGPVTSSTCLSEPVCRAWKECIDWSHGAGAPALRESSFEHEERCRGSKDCFDGCERVADQIEVELGALQEGVPAEQRARVKVVSQSAAVVAVDEVACSGFRCILEGPRYDVTEECKVTFEYPTPASAQSAACGCAALECASPACGAEPSPRTSPAGLSLDELTSTDEFAADNPAPECSTCDTLPVDSPAAAHAKSACLEAQHAGASAEARAQLDARARLLLMLAGDRLSVADRDKAWAAFSAERREGALACEPEVEDVAADIDENPGDEFEICPAESVQLLERDLAVCERLAGVEAGGVPASVAWVLADRCVALLERVNDARTFAGLDNACVDATFSARARASVQSVLRGSFGALVQRESLGQPDSGGGRFPELERTLSLIDDWYVALRASLLEHDEGTVEEEAERALGDVLDAFWSAAQRARRVTLDLEELLATRDPSEADVNAAIDRSVARADQLARDVLAAAHRPPGTSLSAVLADDIEVLPASSLQNASTNGDVLLRLTGDALTALARALERAEPFHDLACRLGGCGPRALAPAFVRTPLASFWSALGALDHDGDGLSSALAALPGTPWREPLLAIAQNRAALLAAVDGATSELESVSLVRADARGLKPAATRLAALMRAGAERAKSYAATGFLALPGARRLHANVSDAGRAATLSALDAASEALAAEASFFFGERQAAATEAAQRGAAERARDAVRTRLSQLDVTLRRLNADAVGISASLLALDASVGTATSGVASVQGALDTGAFSRVGSTRRFVVHGHDGSPARRAAMQPVPIDGFAARDIEVGAGGAPRLAVAARQLVMVEAAGEYSPLCALSRHDSDRPGEHATSLVALVAPATSPSPRLSLAPRPGTTVGPEGFQLVQNGSRADVQQRDKDAKDNGFLKSFLGIVDRFLPPVGSVVSGILGASDPTEDTRTSSRSESVSLHGGVRLAETPFPDLPAAALLLVELPRGASDSSQIRDVHLVQRGATSFVVASDADLYFVVNDHWVPSDARCLALSPADDPHGVTVSVRVAAPNTEVAERSVEALAQVVSTLRQQRNTFVRQGRIIGSQLAQARADAELEFQARSGLDLAALPPVLRDVVEAHLGRELVSIELAVARQGLERSATDVALEAEALLRDLGRLEGNERAVGLSPMWDLRNLGELGDESQERGLLQSAGALSATVSETLLPIIELWHPSALQGARSSAAFQQDAQQLAGVVPETDLVSLVDEVDRLIKRLRTAYASDPLTHMPDSLEQPIVGVSFVRPPQWGPECSGCSATSGGFAIASEARSFAVWNAIEAALRKGEPVPATDCEVDADCLGLPGTRCDLQPERSVCVRASTRAALGIEPTDIYRSSGGQATLSCFLATPVVQQWALVFAQQTSNEDESLRQLSMTGRQLEPRARASQRFVTETGLVEYAMTDASALTSGISLLYSGEDSAFATFQSFADERLLRGRNPVGLSAFSDLSVDFAALSDMDGARGNGIGEGGADGRVSALNLVMRLDARAFASTPPGHELEGVVSTCGSVP